MISKLKRIMLIVWAVRASAGVILLLLLRRRPAETKQSVEEKAQNARNETKEKIEQTAAGDLVNAACNADELRRERESIAERFRAEVRNRLNENLHGQGSAVAH